MINDGSMGIDGARNFLLFFFLFFYFFFIMYFFILFMRIDSIFKACRQIIKVVK